MLSKFEDWFLNPFKILKVQFYCSPVLTFQMDLFYVKMKIVFLIL